MFSALRAIPVFACVFACAAGVYAQAPAAAGSDQAPAAGLENPWEIAPVIQELSDHAGRLLPVLNKVDVRSWVQKGASDTYAAQLQSSKEQAQALQSEAKALAASPERLSMGLQVLFRVQALDSMLASLGEGVRRYQNAKDAGDLAKLAAEAGAGRDRLQRYLVNLAAEKERDLQIMDQEAQRCRGIMTQAPPKTPRKR